ncbi:4-hydroxythreonine-4-phosphate dehydrogenase PdxA [Spirosoma pollinicola]|uniref:4-hydroxythreonine-4-phosphate dehydrogenase PdxA n=1 Tax=Spirosoma pollinicola TaxID=2057025 RepID=A0A2K8YY76_9BACT|nr:4-hydroxythreonine-4-phosphate dehydrogenase PdxA [Spirosoma pollinicola]AUD02586.1 4-hydroxythreonine-4-phosphate dehydrogenase PdxA [Spirosoma pollinicola]
MEQRQSEESNPPRTTPSAAPAPDPRSRTTQEAETGSTSTSQAGNQQEVPARENRNGEPRSNDQRNGGQRNDRNRDGGPRDGGPRDGGPRDGRPPRDGGQNQRENRSQNNRPGREERPAEPESAGEPGAPPTDRPERSQRPNQPNQRPKNQRDGQQSNNQRPTENRQRDDAQPNRNRPANDNRNGQRESISNDPEPRLNNDLSGQVTENMGREDRLVIGISLGDYNGIGPEVILKALQYNRLQKICTPVIYGSMRILNRYRNLLNLKDWNLNGAQSIGQISHKLTNVITCWPDQNQDIQPGQVTADAGQAAFACLQRAVDDLKAGKLDALVTAPINKNNIQSEEFKFPGHTEYLAQEFGVQDNLMFLVSQSLRVGVVTGHVPLGRVRQNITRERIAQKLSLMMRSLKQDFGIEKPKIAVLGLNPHAGEEGLLGTEENDIIKPLIAEWRNKGQLVFGPYPADGFFGTRAYLKFDAVLAMYHDQGLIPFKAIAFEEGVNFTAGMSAVRTSPDHGTAYDIAGKDLADETSMLQAIYTAIDVARNRKEYLELEAGALK